MLLTQDKQNDETQNNNTNTNNNNSTSNVNNNNNNNSTIDNSILLNLSHQQQESLLNIIYTSDLRQLRLLPTSTYNLNYHFPFKNQNINFDLQITPLILSCYIGKLDIFIQLINNDFINVNLPSEPDKYSPLMIACFKGYYEIVRMLLEKNANVNQQNKNGQVPFIFVFSRLEQSSYHYENKKICMMLIDLLLSYGADINTKFDTNKKYTVLMKLVDCELYTDDKFEMIKEMMVFLIERGADVLIKGSNGKNVINVIESNDNMLGKYKSELIRIVNETKQLYYFNDEEYMKINSKEGKEAYFRYGSSVTRNKINEVIFERNEEEGKCCMII